MPAFSASAPGKVILFGEHAVVYGRPALAVPVMQVRAKAIVTAEPKGPPGQVRILAPDVGLDSTLDHLPADHPLAVAITKAMAVMRVSHIPSCTIRITSTIPIAGGMGSGAAVSAATLRALSASLGHPLSDPQISELVYQVEMIYHGTPSGIDNTVITYARPVFFIRGSEINILRVRQAFTMVIGDTGIRSPTSEAVSAVRQAWELDQPRYEQLFNAAGSIAREGRKAIETGGTDALGPLMDENHALLQQMDVSCPELDRLVEAARAAGALGAKLSGAGRGGSMIALVLSEVANDVASALAKAGAVRTIVAEISKT